MRPLPGRVAQIRIGEVFMRVNVAVIAICLAIVGLSEAQGTGAEMAPRLTNIPAQPLGTALKALARELGLQVIYRTDLVDDVWSGGAVGQLTPKEALEKLVDGTGLTYRYLNETTVTIEKASVQ